MSSRAFSHERPGTNRRPSQTDKRRTKRRQWRTAKTSSGEKLEERLFEELLKKYDAATCTLQQWEGIEIPRRKFLVGHWMREGDLGFLYGERGGGKTLFADALATHLSTGKDLFSWAIPDEAEVMYVDGEMPQDDARDRLRGMSTNNPRIHILHHDRLFDQCGGIMNLTQPVSQRVITEHLQEKKHQTPDPR